MRLPVPDKWDYETDVLIVGGGTAGLPAGVAAAEAGAKTTILELAKICGGSGNLIMVGASFGGTDIQKKQGVEDSPELRYRDGVEVAFGEPEMWRVYCDHELELYEWFKEMGIVPWTEELLPVPGHSVPRLHRYVGAPVEQRIEKEARDKGAEILFEHRAKRLIQDPLTERVLGAAVEVKGKTLNFKAKKAVVLTTGSFGRNKQMLKEYGSRFKDCIPLMAPGHLGDGLKMGFDLGAATSHLGDAVVASLAACTTTHADRALMASWTGGIIVNVNGKRFYPESCPRGYYGDITDVGLDQPGKVFWIVYDDGMRNAAGVEEMERHKEFKADSFEELAKAAGIEDVKSFVETVAKYNEDIESEGYDTVFGRKALTHILGDPIPLENPPFYAIKCETSITSFKGGRKVNSRTQVMDLYGEPIRGLYAAGETVGGLFGEGLYLGGTNWPASMVFGKIAGREAAFEKPWDK
jgi:fumarate reductase flavoprotein subunit